MQLFYTQNIVGQNAILNEDEARHVKVLRKNIGDILNIIDGTGYLYEAKITGFADNKKSNLVNLEIQSKTLQGKSRTYYFHLFIAPTKQNERIEWLLEKAIEVGLDAITFIETEHSEKSRINANRLEKIAISAMKQSGEYYLPEINGMVNFEKAINTENNNIKLIAHCNNKFEKQSLKEIFTIQHAQDNITLLIGPEGDFSEKEIVNAAKKGFKGISLGSTRLRTETAGLYATIALSSLK